MILQLYKYHGAGNDFLLADARERPLDLSEAQVRFLCDRHLGIGSDGLMLLENSPESDFRMRFFNPDGSGGMMCGNGGRCIAAFALARGIVPHGGTVTFEAPDGPHTASFPEGTVPQAGTLQVRLKMKDVAGMQWIDAENAVFLDTGTRHLVVPVSGLDSFPVGTEGARLRHLPRFAPQGTNVDFIAPEPFPEGPGLRIRTFEKGVEGETLACGTGIVAAAIVAWRRSLAGVQAEDGRVNVPVRAAVSSLKVDFLAWGLSATDVFLTGPATAVGTVQVEMPDLY